MKFTRPSIPPLTRFLLSSLVFPARIHINIYITICTFNSGHTRNSSTGAKEVKTKEREAEKENKFVESVLLYWRTE